MTLCLVLFGSAFLWDRFIKKRWAQITCLCSPLFIAVGSLMLAFSVVGGAATEFLGVTGAILTGFGSGLLDLGYGEVYKGVQPVRTTLEVPLAFCLSGLVYFAVTLTPSAVACILTALLPLLSGLLLMKNKYNAGPFGTFESDDSIDFEMTGFAWRIGFVTCLAGLADGVSRVVFFSYGKVIVPTIMQETIAISGFITLLIIGGAALLSREFSFRNIYKTSIFVMMFFFMLMPVLTEATVLEGVLSFAGYGTFNALIWLLLCGVAHNYELSSVKVYGIGWGFISLGVFLGATCGDIIVTNVNLNANLLSLLALICTAAVLFSYLFVFKDSDIIAIIQKAQQKRMSKEGAGEGAGVEEIAGQKRALFKERCEHVATTHGLTPKETEVLILLAKGRSRSRIQEELFISEGTVATHLRHIYQKIDVHSRQELLDLIESVTLDANGSSLE